MPLSDKWTLGSHLNLARQELVDPAGRWWPDSELTTYINRWQEDIQNWYELVWGTASIITALSTITLTNIATNILRLDAVYWNNVRLTPKDKVNLDNFRRDWRGVKAQSDPVVVFQSDINSLSMYPPPSTAGTLELEYPISPTSLVSTGDICPLPGWSRYTSANFVALRAYRRHGPRQDQQRVQYYRNLVQRDLNEIRIMKDSYQPEKALSFRPSTKYERQIMQPDLVMVK